MGISAKVVCITKDQNVFKVAKVVEKGLKKLLSEYKSKATRIDPDNRVQRVELSTIGEMISFEFTINKEVRSLSVCFGIMSDYEELGPGPRIVLSVGTWGKSDEIIMAMCKTMSELGPTFYKFNDCSEPDFTKYETAEVELSAAN